MIAGRIRGSRLAVERLACIHICVRQEIIQSCGLMLVFAHGFFDTAHATLSFRILHMCVWSARRKLNLVLAAPRK
jgi:hypothetical protein